MYAALWELGSGESMSNDAIDMSARDHAWQYFALHASQRMSVFNFFAVFAGVLAAAIGAAFDPLPLASFALGLLLGVVWSYPDSVDS